jgi:hypothetical protein
MTDMTRPTAKTMTACKVVAPGPKWHHGPVPTHREQRKFRLDETRGKVWDDALAVSGLTQQKAMETIVDALGFKLLDLMQLRVDTTRAAREAPAEE